MRTHRSPFIICLALTLLCGALINAPFHNFQVFLAQGDHGRDLYAAERILHGDIPYRDFWWVYGPLMPYYYALFFKLFGVQISSILLGKIVLNMAAGVFFFLGAAEVFPAIAALAAALWFLTFHLDFFFTYNHAGGIAMMLGAVWMHLAYLKRRSPACAWGALAFVFILGLIKINFALTALVMTVIVVAAADRWARSWANAPRAHSLNRKLFYTSALMLIPLLWWGAYSWFLRGLSITEIRQCLPYLGGDEPYNTVGPLQTLPILAQNILNGIAASPTSIAMCVLVLLSLGHGIFLMTRRDRPAETRLIVLTAAYSVLFYALNLHEFIKSGVHYRSFWAQPLSMLLMFTVLVFSIQPLPRWTKTLLWSVLLLLIAVSAHTTTQTVNSFKTGQHYLGGKRGGVYVTNDRHWLQTVVLTTKQLETAFPNREPFLALPYDCLYYYMTGTKSPTRQLIFFDHINIPAEQEQTIIADLESNRIAGVLVSSRQNAQERGLGTLGVSYCPLLAQYFNTQFTPVAKIGDWVNEPGWAWNHGTLILKRISPEQ